ncbi:MAG: coenzyme F420-0:L-glutamate ligase [Anaerolineae bacterium]|nr:coenzyme F420-0:L-glutamate ligase [Anaerolineae bacterium]NUQ03251.1 coenzyme F420-0:L-glutamate ligase [Anaerolineae bacterium]
MKRQALSAIPLEAPVQQDAFDLIQTLLDALRDADETLQHGDILAISSKYAAIAEGRIVRLADIAISPQAAAIAERYQMIPAIVELVLSQADHVFGGIPGFLLTYKDGILSPNAGIDRSNIPPGNAVLFPANPYATAAAIRAALHDRLTVSVGVILTDSWLMPGRIGSTGVALATAGFAPVSDERGMTDLFGNKMQVTRRSITDQICAAAQLVMGERDEATPFVIVRGTGVAMTDAAFSAADVAIAWQQCIYVQSLTAGLLNPSSETAEPAAPGIGRIVS